MKKLLLLIAILFVGLTAKAQVSQDGYFSIKDNFIIWTKIYETNPDLESMKKNLLLEFTSDNEGIIKKARPATLTKRPLNEIIGNFRIDQKEGRYKVEVSNIRIIPTYTVSLYGISSTESDDPLEASSLNKRNEFTDFFLNHVAKPYDNLFSTFFDPKNKNEDW